MLWQSEYEKHKKTKSEPEPEFTAHVSSVVSDGFLDDIALPNMGLELEWERQKHNKSYMEEVEKYKKEILLEGLQVREQVQRLSYRPADVWIVHRNRPRQIRLQSFIAHHTQ